MVALLLSLSRPSREQQKSCINNSGGCFNYDPEYHRATSPPGLPDSALVSSGFHINRARVLLGSGSTAFRRAESALRTWRHFGLGWAFVDPDTPVEEGVSFCVCVKELVPWVAMPLQIAYMKDTAPRGGGGGDVSGNIGKGSSFGFGSGTLRGHLLAGEERFSIEWDENDQVWYEIFSFSKPAHILSALSYPYVKLRQKYFAKQSAQAVLSYVANQESPI